MTESDSGSTLTARLLPGLIGLVPLLALYLNRAVVLPMVAIALLGAWEAIRGRDLGLPMPRFVTVALALPLLWGAASVIWAFDPSLPLPRAVQLLGLIVGGLLGMRATQAVTPGRILSAAMAGLIVACLVALADIVTGCHLLGLAHGITNEALTQSPPAPRFKAGVSVLALWGGAVAWAALDRRWWLRSAVVLGLIGLLANRSSGGAAILALGLGGGFGLATLILPRLGPALLGLLAVALVMASPLAVDMPPSLDLATRYPALPSSTLHRTMIWHFAATKAMERPVLGWGLDASRIVPGGEEREPVWERPNSSAPPKIVNEQRIPLHPHDFALQVWLEMGAVGAVLVAGLLGALVVAGARLRRGAPRAGAMTTIAAAMVVAAVSYGAWQAWWVASLWLTAALAARMLAGNADSDATRR